MILCKIFSNVVKVKEMHHR